MARAHDPAGGHLHQLTAPDHVAETLGALLGEIGITAAR
jgi:hypothetical protein